MAGSNTDGGTVAKKMVDLGIESVGNLKAGSDDITMAAAKALGNVAGSQATSTAVSVGGDAAAKAAGDAVMTTAAGAASAALGGVALVDSGAQAVSGITDLVDPTHEARSAKNGKNVVSGGIGAVANAIDTVGDGIDSALKDSQDAVSKIPVIGGIASLPIGINRMAASTVQNVVVSTTRHIEEASNAIGNEANGSRSTHSERMDEDDILKTDDWADAMRKGGVTGMIKKLIGDTKTKEESLDDAAKEGADWLDDMHESGTLTDREVQNAGRLLASDKSAFVETVESVRRGDKTAEEAFGGTGAKVASTDGGPASGSGNARSHGRRRLADAPDETGTSAQAQEQMEA